MQKVVLRCDSLAETFPTPQSLGERIEGWGTRGKCPLTRQQNNPNPARRIFRDVRRDSAWHVCSQGSNHLQNRNQEHGESKNPMSHFLSSVSDNFAVGVWPISVVSRNFGFGFRPIRESDSISEMYHATQLPLMPSLPFEPIDPKNMVHRGAQLFCV